MFKNLIPWARAHDTDIAKSGDTDEMSPFFQDFDKMIENFWNADTDDLSSGRWGCEMQDAENELVVRAEAPGFSPEEIDVQLSGNRLVMQAEHKTESGNGSRRYSQYGKLYRSVTVPSGIEADKIEASYKNGVLEVHLPKGERARSKRISVASK